LSLPNAQMSHALAGPRAAGVDQGLPYWLALVAEGYGKSGQLAEGLSLLSEALGSAIPYALLSSRSGSFSAA
jgi:hypothetical protein